MKSTILFVIVSLVLLVLVQRSTSASCEVDEDCAGHQSGAFCTNVECLGGTCLQAIAPCIAQCNEALRQCVDCNTNADCGEVLEICDQQTHQCRACNENADCQAGSYCYGGHWVCVAGHCYAPPPSTYPCLDNQFCDEEARMCRECILNSDCGTWDYCDNPRHCNLATGTCVRDDNITNCAAMGLKCRSETESCVECDTNQDCLVYGNTFCEPLNTCDAIEGTCSWNGEKQCHSSNTSVTYCDENRKMCVEMTCHDELHTLCDDGNDCNGKEICLPTGKCRAAEVLSCPENSECDIDGIHCTDWRENMFCIEQRDCAAAGFICRIASEDDPTIKKCTRCRNHAQCSDGDFSNGEELCNGATGKCGPGVSPCESAPVHMDYNTATGQCDLDLSLVATQVFVIQPGMKPSILLQIDNIQEGEITLNISETLDASDAEDQEANKGTAANAYVATVTPTTLFDSTRFRLIFGSALVFVIIVVTGGLYVSSGTRCCINTHSKRSKKVKTSAESAILSDSFFDAAPEHLKEW